MKGSTTCEPASESKAEHAAMAKMGKKSNAGKHFAPKFASKGQAGKKA